MKFTNKILKFIEMISESHEQDEIELRAVTLDLSDELIDFEIHKGYFSKQAIDKGQIGDKVLNIIHSRPIYDDDKWCFCIEIPLEQLQDSIQLGQRLGNKKLIQDKKIFTIFTELSQISTRYGNCFLYINSGTVSYRPAIYLFILLDTQINMADAKLTQIFKEIKSRNSVAKSDFSNDTTVRLEADNIVIKSRGWSYTDRKFRGLIRDIDLSDYKIEKTIDGGESSGLVINTISKK
jgi:hypothetical protein